MSKITSVKQKLLTILKKEHDASIDDIMVHFSISEIAVRKHLRQLENEGFIKKTVNKQEIGRPYHTYQLTKKGHDTFSNQNDRLPLEILQDLEELKGKELVYELLQKRMERETEFLESQLQTSDMKERLTQFAKIQNERGYMIEIEQTDDGHYLIKNYHCPIASIAFDYQKICGFEKNLYEQIFTNCDIKVPARITSGDHFCKWMIKKQEKR